MKTILKNLSVCALAGSMALSACSVVAERPEGAGRGRDNDRHERHDDDRRGDRRDERRDRRDDDRRDDHRGGTNAQMQIGGYFGERQRASVYEYYGQPARAHCPPGLAKKGNGCQPPGQAKQWRMGQPLPRDVSYRPVEAEVRVRLGTPPAGHEFVRVAGDILLIAVGTSMVIDAIEDLQR